MDTNINDRGAWTSASNAEADFLCPGRHQAQAGLPEQSSAVADSGTRIHAALAAGKPDGLNTTEAEMFDACKTIEQKVVEQFFGEAVKGKASPGIREKRFWHRGPTFSHSGQLDVVHRLGVKALIIDYKTGSGDVPTSPRNRQLRDLVSLYWTNTTMLKQVGVVVIQPLVTHSPEICIYEHDDVLRATQEMLSRVNASNQPNAMRVAGATQCRYCRAWSTCPVHAEWASSQLPEKVVVDRPVAEWTGDDFALFLDREGVAQRWLDACHAAALKFAQDGGTIPGYALKEGMVRESVNKPQEVFDRFSKLGGTLESFMETISVVKGRLRDAVATATKTRGKTLDSTMDALLAGCVESKETNPSLRRVK